jgi:precorrin-2 C(20)-methyltransferase
VGFITIGDPMVYSTYIYLLKLLKQKIKIKTIPGIASFLDIAANNNFPLAEGDDPLIILPATVGTEKLRSYIKNENSVVLMKVYKNFDEVVKLLLEENLEKYSLIVSNSSKDDEIIYHNIKDINKSDVSYFTTILINKRLELL